MNTGVTYSTVSQNRNEVCVFGHSYAEVPFGHNIRDEEFKIFWNNSDQNIRRNIKVDIMNLWQ